MEQVLNNPFFIAAALLIVFIVLPVLLFVYLPRAAEIADLKRTINRKNAVIARMARNQTAAELEHNADIDWMRKEIEDAQRGEGIARARKKQTEEIAEQIARAHGRLAGKGDAA